MTQTKVKGWCAWHENTGFVYEMFSRYNVPVRICHRIAEAFNEYPDPFTGRDDELEKYLISEGWKVRPCTITIQATDISVAEMRELHGISSEDRKGSRDEVDALSGQRVEGGE